jgi:hypothetical protein
MNVVNYQSFINFLNAKYVANSQSKKYSNQSNSHFIASTFFFISTIH